MKRKPKPTETVEEVPQPYAVECINGAFCVVQAKTPQEAEQRIRDEYGLEPLTVKKVE